MEKNHCLVCGTDLSKGGSGANCSLCGFPKLDILGDFEKELLKMQPRIEKHRMEFLSKCSAGIVSYNYSYDETDNIMKSSGQRRLSFGRLSDILNKTVTLPDSFDCPSKRDSVEITLFISTPNGEQQQEVSISNRFSEKPVKLGINLDKDMKFQLVVSGGDDNRISASDKRYIF